MNYRPHHVWAGNTVTLECRLKHRKRESRREVILDFDELGIARGGLLDVCIQDSPTPLDVNAGGKLKRVLKGVCAIKTLREILSTPPGDLYTWQIDTLLAGFEDEIAGWNVNANLSLSAQARHIFQYCRRSLADGRSISECGFNSRFPSLPRKRTLPLAEDFDDAFDVKAFAEPLSTVDFKTLTDRDESALTHLRVRLDRVLAKCELVVDQYLALRERLYALQAAPVPEELTRKMKIVLARGGYFNQDVWKSLSEETQFWVAVHISIRDNFARSYPTRYITFQGISELENLVCSTANQAKFEVLLSATYIPRYVLIACLIIVQAAMIWNMDTALSLTPKRIKLHRNRVEVFGIKSKVRSKQDGAVSVSDNEITPHPTEIGWNEITDQRTCKIIRLLLDHSRAISKYATRDSESVFCALNLKSTYPLRFQIPDYPRDLHAFIEKNELPSFTLDDLRDHAANIYYLQTGRNIQGVSIVMGHASLSATEDYLNTTIIRLLGEANLKRYMDILGPTIVFACRGRSAVEALKMDTNRIDDRLLFPVSSMTAEEDNSLADQWISSNGNLQLKLGANEIQHCALQMLFYKTNLRRLINDNELRFKTFHLPRLVFCVALYQFIKSSRYGFILEQCEEVLNAA